MTRLPSFAIAIAVILIGGSVASSAEASITARAISSRNTSAASPQVAPLAVHFDATTTTCTGCADPFLDLHYAWDFGDPASGTWSISGKSKNVAFGSIAAHVYDNPGTYTVVLTVTDGTVQDSVTMTINVSDPDSVFGGNKTICFRENASGGFAGCPSGAQQRTEGSWSDIVATARQGMRLLLRRGDEWSSSPQRGLLDQKGPGIIGAFGSGAKPRISGLSGSDSDAINLRSSSDWRIMDLHFVAPSSEDDSVFYSSVSTGPLAKILVYRVDVDGFRCAVQLGSDRLLYGATHPDRIVHEELFVVDSTIRNTGSWGIYAGVKNFVIMGTSLDDTGSHTIRTTYMAHSLLQHSYIGANSNDIGSQLKLHGVEWEGGNPLAGHPTEYVIISDNHVDSSNTAGQWPVAIGPQSHNASTSSSDMRNEHIEHFIFERNWLTAGPRTNQFISMWGADSMIRNNIVDMTGASDFTFVLVKNTRVDNGIPVAPEANRNRIYNNTFYKLGDEGWGDVVAVRIVADGSSIPTDTLVANNLLFAPDASQTIMLQDGGRNTIVCSSCNVTVSELPFVEHPATAPSHFSLVEDHPLLAAGIAISPNRIDFSASGEFPVGAFAKHVGALAGSVDTVPGTTALLPPVLLP